jgi:hypothetical protein
MMLSLSTNAIEWIKPDIRAEEWEFFKHPLKQSFYHRHGICWERLLESSENGRMVPYPRGDRLEEVEVSLSYSSYDDYARYLAKAKRGYRRSYAKMEEELQRSSKLVLPAAVIIECAGEALLFSGYRRLCLAWNYGMIPYVWFVPLGGGK